MAIGGFSGAGFSSVGFSVTIVVTPGIPWGDGVGGGRGHKFPNKREKEEEEEILMLIKIIHERRYKMVMGDG